MKSGLKKTEQLIWLIFYPFVIIAFLFMANENSIAELLQIPSFKTDVIFALIIVYTVGFFIHKLSQRLDFEYQINEFRTRIKHQIIKGIILPSIIAMIFEIIYLHNIQISFSESTILNLEFPLSLLFLGLINSYYLFRFIYNNKPKEIIKTIEVQAETKDNQRKIIVQKGINEEKIDLSDCAFIKSSNKILWLYTLNGEIYRIQGTLEYWEEKLKEEFFRINRQFLVSQKAVITIEQTETRKLKVNLCVPQDEEVFISKLNSVNFRKWWNKDCLL